MSQLGESVERFQPNSNPQIQDLWVEHARYMPVKQMVRGKRILDLGCGTGFSSKLILSWGASSVTGVDSDAAAIQSANEHYSNDNLTFLVGYAEQISDLVTMSDFDGICFVECLEHVYEPELVLRKLRDFVKPEAWIYITAPNDFWNYKYSDTENPYHLRKYEYDNFIYEVESILGRPMETGQCHGFLGFATSPDALINQRGGAFAEAICFDDFDNPPNTNEALFYYALWGSMAGAITVAGSIQPMELFTQLNDVSNLTIDSERRSKLIQRELQAKLQIATEALVEEQNKLNALGFLLANGTIKNLQPGIHKSASLVTHESIPKLSYLQRFLRKPPHLILKTYSILPQNAKDYLRRIRRRFLNGM